MIYELGYRLTDAASLKRKHVEALVERWKAEDLAIGTIKNRMADPMVGREDAVEASPFIRQGGLDNATRPKKRKATLYTVRAAI